ncbi:MAG TPA: M23 family metallopeptidase [Candidatus Paceibacterota bacterium]
MRKKFFRLLKLLFLTIIILPISSTFAETATISVNANPIIQGDPLLIIVENVGSIADIQKIFFDGKPLWFFTHQGKPTALIGVDLNKKPSDYKISVKLENGKNFEKIITVKAREKLEEPLGIPEKLGGNTPASQKTLISSLASENDVINNLRSISKKLWPEEFKYPLINPVVTDSYGYTRITGNYSVAHKGVDFRAKESTPVKAMGRGIVRLVRTFRNYGKTVVIDHGLGLMTFYMHLSKIYVNEGELVSQGQLIALSGQTGYAETPHLHLSVKIGGISIDPVKFLGLFK